MVDVRGVKFPAYIDQLEFPYFKRFSEKKIVPPVKKARKFIDEVPKEKGSSVGKSQSPADKSQAGIWITFIAVIDTDDFGDEVVEELKIHLVNRTDKAYKFDYSLNYADKPGFELSNQLNTFQDFYIHDMPFENMNDGPSFSVVFSLVKPDKTKAESFETFLKLKPKQVFTRIQEIRKKGRIYFFL